MQKRLATNVPLPPVAVAVAGQISLDIRYDAFALSSHPSFRTRACYRNSQYFFIFALFDLKIVLSEFMYLLRMIVTLIIITIWFSERSAADCYVLEIPI